MGTAETASGLNVPRIQLFRYHADTGRETETGPALRGFGASGHFDTRHGRGRVTPPEQIQ